MVRSDQDRSTQGGGTGPPLKERRTAWAAAEVPKGECTGLWWTDRLTPEEERGRGKTSGHGRGLGSHMAVQCHRLDLITSEERVAGEGRWQTAGGQVTLD